jgi:hypothetical protein
VCNGNAIAWQPNKTCLNNPMLKYGIPSVTLATAMLAVRRDDDDDDDGGDGGGDGDDDGSFGNSTYLAQGPSLNLTRMWSTVQGRSTTSRIAKAMACGMVSKKEST